MNVLTADQEKVLLKLLEFAGSSQVLEDAISELQKRETQATLDDLLLAIVAAKARRSAPDEAVTTVS